MQNIKLLIFDRDGVLVRAMPRGQYLLRLDQLEILPGALELVRAVKALGYKVVVATNQPQIAKGMLTLEDLEEIHREMSNRLKNLIDTIYFCPHRNEDSCHCRKPKPGMLLQAMTEYGVTSEETIMVGDTDVDVLTGQAADCRTVFLRDDQNASELVLCSPDFVVDKLAEVIPLLLGRRK